MIKFLFKSKNLKCSYLSLHKKKTHIIESVSSDKKECPWYLVTSVMVKRILKHLSEKVIANSLVEPSQKRAIWYLTLELILHGNNSKAGNRFINPIFSN